MKYIQFLLLSISFSIYGQEVIILESKVSKTYNFSQGKQDLWTTCDSLNFDKSFQKKYSQEEKNSLNNKCNESSNSICDLTYKTAWAEGVKGYDIGEFTTFQFKPLHPRITKAIIANGYIKDKKTGKTIYV